MKRVNKSGLTCSKNKPFISDGTPGKNTNQQRWCCKAKPGAVPHVLSMRFAVWGNSACFLLTSGMGRFLRSKNSLICSKAISSNSKGLLKALATASAVKSSEVGPNPPVQIQQSALAAMSLSKLIKSVNLSPTAVWRVTVKPQ